MEGKDFDQTLDLKKIKPYGDTMNDGKTQLSFTLPVPAGDEAVEAAKQLLQGGDGVCLYKPFQNRRASYVHKPHHVVGSSY